MLINSEENSLIVDELILAEKGIFVYDVSFGIGHGEEYIQIATPKKSLLIEQLPAEILTLLDDHKTSANATTDKSIRVEHAY